MCHPDSQGFSNGFEPQLLTALTRSLKHRYWLFSFLGLTFYSLKVLPGISSQIASYTQNPHSVSNFRKSIDTGM